MKKILIVFIISVCYLQTRADEGMWLPLLLENYTIEEMQKDGFKLSAGDVYSMNQSSLKDAVVIFGGGCTAEVISTRGLIITNHHCGYSNIQSHSSVEKDYLTDGFWAGSNKEELANPGLSVRFLDYIEDVSEEMLDVVDANMPEELRQQVLREKRREISERISSDEFTQAVVKPFFFGNQYFLFVYKIFKDVRLVGAPPSSIGKFGGDTDNWIWPRHTGDFSLFRIYADKNNEPADYAPENIPYKPKNHIPISLKGYQKGDFTMVMGYPGSTQRYITSDEVEIIMKKELPQKIRLRDHRLAVMNDYMENDSRVRIQYAAKYNRVSNAWKKWQGMINGLQRLDAIEKKQLQEDLFLQWNETENLDDTLYDNVLNTFEDIYSTYEEPYLAGQYWNEVIFASELMRQVYRYWKVMEDYEMGNAESAEEQLDNLINGASGFFKNFHLPIDRDIFPGLMVAYKNNLPKKFHPYFFEEVLKKHDGDMSAFTDRLYSSTLFLDQDELQDLKEQPLKRAMKKLQKDDAMVIFKEFVGIYRMLVFPELSRLETDLDSVYRIYMTGLKKMYPDSIFSPDANFTMRVTHGEVMGYNPADGVEYEYYTTLTGVVEKDDPSIVDYNVPPKLKQLYKNKDYGPYAQDGEMRVCFIATNHTSGGNSGSPVLNADGHLIGVNFDRNWEGTMSDIMYDPAQCRNITLDIRYALFIIDKFAGANYLIEEMEIIQ